MICRCPKRLRGCCPKGVLRGDYHCGNCYRPRSRRSKLLTPWVCERCVHGS